MTTPRTDGTAFEWRVATGRWRWLMLGTLGAANACWGQTEEETAAGPREQGTTNPGVLQSAAGSGGNTSPDRCAEATPLGGGWVRCANGLIHRFESSQCTSTLPRADGIDPGVIERLYPGYGSSAQGTGGAAARNPGPPCERDSDCTQRPLGHCEFGDLGDGSSAVFCQYGCVSDADCDSGLVCLCGEPVGQCYRSSCSTDADCAGDGRCANYDASPGCSSLAFACQTSRDQCAVDQDCPAEQTCALNEYAEDPKRFCSERTYVCGRPFLIDGSARLACIERRADWYSDAGARARSELACPLELRPAVAQGWLDQALMEHASVAAFARFSLQLLSLGAPAELVSEAARALQDEIEHARDCFALAHRHADRDLGPGPLALAGALEAQDLHSIVLGTIAEGCIGETLAALEAAEALAHCEDRAARSVLERIAADETRHAQLAWRFVAWALETGPASLRPAVRDAFARELSAAEQAPRVAAASSFERRLLQQGLMGAGLRQALRERVLRDVIAPCSAALLARGSVPLLDSLGSVESA